MASKTNAPAFQFYSADWLSDENVRLMTLEQTGAYIDALAICWREGSIPSCPEKLARLIGKGCSTEVATSVQRLFNIRSTDECSGVERLKHKRLEIEREKQRVRSEQTSKAGKKSAATKREAIAKPSENGDFNISSTSVQHPFNPSSSPSGEDGRSAQVGVSAVAEEGVPSDQRQDAKPKAKRSARATEEYIAPEIPQKLDTPEFRRAWGEWEQHRREIKHPLKTTQARKQIEEFAHRGVTWAVAAINYTIAKGWRGIAEPEGLPAEKPKQRVPDMEEILRRGYSPQTGLGG